MIMKRKLKHEKFLDNYLENHFLTPLDIEKMDLNAN